MPQLDLPLEQLQKSAGRNPKPADFEAFWRVWEMDLVKDAYAERKTYFRNFDPRHERETEIFTALGHIDVQHLMPRVTGEILMATGPMDAVCPPSTQFAPYNKIENLKQSVIYPDFGHEELPDLGDRVWEFLGGL